MIKIGGEKIKFEKFPNGESLLKNHDIIISDSLRGERAPIKIKFKYIDDASLMELYLIKQEIDAKFPEAEVFLEVAYLPYSRMDRGSTSTCFTLKHISKFINDLQFDHILIGEPHSNVCLDMIKNSKPEWYTKEILRDYMDDHLVGLNNEAILFPDAGASKRYGEILKDTLRDFKKLSILTGEKVRDFETGRIKSLNIPTTQTDFRRVIIVDDLCSYGGTFKLAIEALEKINTQEVILIVGNCEKSIVDGDLLNHPLLKKVYTTNSIINRVYENEYPKLNIKAVI